MSDSKLLPFHKEPYQDSAFATYDVRGYSCLSSLDFRFPMAMISVTILVVLCEDINLQVQGNKLIIASVLSYLRYHLYTSVSLSFLTKAYIKLNILRNWLKETHAELFYLWNSLVCTRLTKVILGKMILISVLLGRKKYS